MLAFFSSTQLIIYYWIDDELGRGIDYSGKALNLMYRYFSGMHGRIEAESSF